MTYADYISLIEAHLAAIDTATGAEKAHRFRAMVVDVRKHGPDALRGRSLVKPDAALVAVTHEAIDKVERLLGPIESYQ